MGQHKVAGLDGFDGSVAVRRGDSRSGGEAVEDLRPGGGVRRRAAGRYEEGIEVSFRRVVGDVKDIGSAVTENGIDVALEVECVPE